MQLDLGVPGRTVLVLGTQRPTRPAGPPGQVRVVAAPAPDDTSGLLRLLGPARLVVHVDPPAALRLDGTIVVLTVLDRLPAWTAP